MTKDETKTGAKRKSGDSRFDFQAEVARLLQLMVHSVYSEKEIFLRELISNAADACDKLRYEAITRPEVLSDDPNLRITITVDPERKTLDVADNGIGMTRAELIDNLGTIARSGTRAFLDRLEKDKEAPSFIGQFGVGFYSAFMVADRVEVLSRKAGGKQAHLWASDGTGGFTVNRAPKELADTIARGTVVTLHLNENATGFLQEEEIARIVRAYSDHIPFQIDFQSHRDGKEERRQLNSASALWTRPRSEIGADHYREFYRHVAGLVDEPALTIHYRAEGRHEYTVLLFVPSMQPFDLYDPSRSGRLRLYVRRVFITDEADILPAYLRFVRGVIDSEDMPLNISREMLQNNPIVAAIRKAVTNRVLSEIQKCAENDKTKFETVWESFGPVLKEGLYEDPERRDQLFAIARFRSTRGEDWFTLAEYVAGMRPNQTAIYYLAGESPNQLRASPQLEGFRARGVEVLLLADPVDHFWVTAAAGFEGKPFQSITQGEVDLSAIPLLEEGEDADKDKPDDKTSADAAKLIERLKPLFADTASDVRASARLVNSPACLVAPAGGPDRGLDKILGKQAGRAGGLPVLEINPGHPLVKALQKKAKAKGKDTDAFEDLAWLLLDEARILEGSAPADPAKFAERMNKLVLAGLK